MGAATLRDRLANGELDLVLGPVGLLMSLYCGWGGVRRPCFTGLLWGAATEAVTVSNAWWQAGVRDAGDAGRLWRKGKLGRRPTFAVGSDLGREHYRLRSWLRTGGFDPDRDVRVVTVPVTLLVEAMEQGHLDGFAAPEPWGSVAVRKGCGWVASPPSEMRDGAPGQALVAVREVLDERPDEFAELLAVLIEACRRCDEVEVRQELVGLVHGVFDGGVETEAVANALVGPFEMGHGRRDPRTKVAFDVMEAGAPTREAGREVHRMLESLPRVEGRVMPPPGMPSRLYRMDQFSRAKSVVTSRVRGAGGGGTTVEPSTPTERTVPPEEDHRASARDEDMGKGASGDLSGEILRGAWIAA